MLDHVFTALSRVGSGSAIWVVLAAALAFASRRPLVLLTIPVCYLTSIITYGIKLLVDRPRPGLDPLVRLPDEPSFPSGHSATSFAGATMLSAVAPRYWPAFYLLAAGIAFSRIYVGVHWPLDVLVGSALGAALAAAAITSLRWRGLSLRRSPQAPPPG